MRPPAARGDMQIPTRRPQMTETKDPSSATAPVDRRQLLKMTGAGVVALGAASIFDITNARAQDMSNGAANFYTSDKVTLQRVTYKSLYQMNVAGNLFLP